MNLAATDQLVNGEEATLPPALVIGDGPSGLLSARALMDIGISVTLVRTDSPRTSLYCSGPGLDVEQYLESLQGIIEHVELVEPQGRVRVQRNGNGFDAALGSGPRRLFGCVFITTGTSATQASPGLPPGVTAVSPGGLPILGKETAFLLDYGVKSDPATGMTAIRQALKNVEAGGGSSVIMQNVPVAHTFGETLYEDAKRAGVQFYRFGAVLPEIEPLSDDPDDDGSMRITVYDIVETGEPVVLEVDRLLFAGTPDASSIPLDVRDIVSGEQDEQGFLIPSSIHCRSGRSFVNGVFAVGEATGSVDLVRVSAQAASSAQRARAWMLKARSRTEADAVTFTDECVRCLTCLRLCPHIAISLVSGAARSTVQACAAACQECGVCVSECPRLVLDLVYFPEQAISSFLDDVSRTPDARPVVVYGCQRSPGRAAARISLPDDALLLTVPCAGRISESVLWATLAAGVKGVLVVGCHHGNCESNSGTDWAATRVASVVEKLNLPDGTPRPIQYTTVAANEEARFKRVVEEFCTQIRGEYSSCQ